jgi:hypothetical protein
MKRRSSLNGRVGSADAPHACHVLPQRRSELRRRGLSVDGLLSDIHATAFAELERLLLFHIITVQPCDVVRTYWELTGVLQLNNRCWDRFTSMVFEGTDL